MKFIENSCSLYNNKPKMAQFSEFQLLIALKYNLYGGNFFKKYIYISTFGFSIICKNVRTVNVRKPNVRISDNAEIRTIDRSDFDRLGLGVSVWISDTLS